MEKIMTETMKFSCLGAAMPRRRCCVQSLLTIIKIWDVRSIGRCEFEK